MLIQILARARAAEQSATSAAVARERVRGAAALEAAAVAGEKQAKDEKKKREEEKKRSQDLAAELNDVQKRLTREMNNRVRRLRLPREHETTKEPVEMIVRYGRIYPVQRYIRGASSGFNSGAIKLTSVGDELRELAPIPGKGIDPSNNIRAIVDYYKQLPRNSYLVFRVYGDSFGQFSISKEAASRMGKELSWVPLEDDARIMMGFGSGAPPPPPL